MLFADGPAALEIKRVGVYQRPEFYSSWRKVDRETKVTLTDWSVSVFARYIPSATAVAPAQAANNSVFKPDT
eukprot:8696681-Lingulodinium_polyedra.AAC.1